MMADIVDRNERQKLTRVIRSPKNTPEEKSKQRFLEPIFSAKQCQKIPCFSVEKETRVCSGGVMMVQIRSAADAILKLKQPQKPQSAGQKLRYITGKAKYEKLYA